MDIITCNNVLSISNSLTSFGMYLPHCLRGGFFAQGVAFLKCEMMHQVQPPNKEPRQSQPREAVSVCMQTGRRDETSTHTNAGRHECTLCFPNNHQGDTRWARQVLSDYLPFLPLNLTPLPHSPSHTLMPTPHTSHWKTQATGEEKRRVQEKKNGGTLCFMLFVICSERTTVVTNE